MGGYRQIVYDLSLVYMGGNWKIAVIKHALSLNEQSLQGSFVVFGLKIKSHFSICCPFNFGYFCLLSRNQSQESSNNTAKRDTNATRGN